MNGNQAMSELFACWIANITGRDGIGAAPAKQTGNRTGFCHPVRFFKRIRS